MSATNTSLIFGIPSSAPADKSVLLHRNHQNCKAALKLAGVSSPSSYTTTVLNHIADKVSRKDMVLTPQNYYICVLTLEDLPRSNQQKEIEESIKQVSNKIICYGSTDVRRDSAALWAMSDLMKDLDSGKIIKADEKNVTDYLLCCLKCCHIPCDMAHPSKKAALSGDADTNKKNQENLHVALLELGFTDVNHPAVQKTMQSLMAGTGVVPPMDIAEQLIALGIKRDPIKSLVLKTTLKQRLGTYYPVELVWPAFPFGTGTGGSKAGLGAEATKPSYGDQATQALVGALPDLLKTANNLANKYGETKIAEMNAEFEKQMKQMMQSQTGQSSGSITPDQIAAFAQQNAEAAQAALAAAAQKSQIDLAELQKKQNQTLMYVGIGAGALLLVGLLTVVATRK